MSKLKNTLLSFTLILTLSLNPLGAAAIAQAPPPPPPPDSAPPPPPADTPPPAPTSAPPPPPNADPTPTPVPEVQTQQTSPTPTETSSQQSEPTPTSQQSQSQEASPTPTGTSETQTGDANSSGTIINDGNINTSDTAPATSDGVSITNSENGSGSTNTGSATISDSSETTQNNSATINNTMNNTATTGENTDSKNTKSEATISTGDANASGTIINNVNTNAAGVMVSEFNVVDDHNGDIVLDFAANCISGCAQGGSVINSGNGDNTTNSGVLSFNTNDATFQNNEATIGNNLILAADSGSNTTDKNTGADSLITTGDANVSANVINNVNNNIEGAIVYGVVNIYGDLHGDIVLPEEALAGCCGTPSATLANTGNGDGSTNTATLASNTANTVTQTNTANIDNVLIVDATSGENDASRNTGGNSSIETGNTSVNAQVVNVANSNVAGDTWWLVLVNEAGKWIGKIVGSPDGATMAGSQGTQFEVNQNGAITVTNDENGAGSTNTANVADSSTTTVTQTNTAHITNTLDLSSNSGNNSASRNTNGSSSITTGDANIMANIMNFVNNNITGGGKVFVTVVNVFGSWIGDFVAPGQKKQEHIAAVANPSPAIGGPSEELTILPTIEPVVEQEESSSSEESSQTTVTRRVVRRRIISETIVSPTIGTLQPLIFSSAFLASLEADYNKPDYFTVPEDTYLTPENSMKMKINLAWLILSFPFGILAWLSKKFEILAYLRTLLFHT